jgi:serine/threonine protein kinase
MSTYDNQIFQDDFEENFGNIWTRRDYLVTLWFYMNHRSQMDSKSPLIIKIAHLLGRSPSSIALRFGNFASLDPKYRTHGIGLENSSDLCRRIYDKWHDDLAGLQKSAEDAIADLDVHTLPLFENSEDFHGKIFGKYDVLDLINESGAFGDIYSCIDVESNKCYAIKVLKLSSIYNDDVLHRFKREIRALKLKKHDNIVRIYEDNLDDNEKRIKYVMDIANISLQDYLCEQGQKHRDIRPILCHQESVTILKSIVDAVIFLHETQPILIHRDINPRNILMLPSGVWVLADFGLAKFLSTAPVSTAFTTEKGKCWVSEGYSAPEQYKDFSSVDERADIYSLGILLWELFTCNGPPRMIEDSGLSEGLNTVYKKATERNPEKRYKTVVDFKKDLMINL